MITYNIQLGGYDVDRLDQKGIIDFAGFMKVLYSFPWIAEVEKTNVSESGCSPTVSAVNKSDEKNLWVSIIGDANSPVYLLGYGHIREKRGFFGLGKSKLAECVDTYEVSDIRDLEAYYALFFRGAYQELGEALKRI